MAVTSLLRDRAQLREQDPPDNEPLPPVEESQFRRGLRSGTAQLRAVGSGLAAQGAALVGADDFAQEQLGRAEEQSQVAARVGPRVTNVNDIESFDDLKDYVSGLFGSQAPILGTLALGGPAGLALRGTAARLGAGAAQRLSPGAAVTGGVVGSGSALESGSIFNELRQDPENDQTLRESAGTAAGFGLAAGSLEALPVLRLFQRFGVGRAAERRLLNRVAKAAGEQAVLEAGTEGLQTIIEREARKFANENFEVFGEEGLDEIVNAIAAGGIVGGALGGLSGIPRGSALEDEIADVEANDELVEAEGRARANRLRGIAPDEELDTLDTFIDPENVDRLNDLELRFSDQLSEPAPRELRIARRLARNPDEIDESTARTLRDIATGQLDEEDLPGDNFQAFLGSQFDERGLRETFAELREEFLEQSPEGVVQEFDLSTSTPSPPSFEFNRSGRAFVPPETSERLGNENFTDNSFARLRERLGDIDPDNPNTFIREATLRESVEADARERFPNDPEAQRDFVVEQAREELARRGARFDQLFDSSDPAAFLENFRVVAREEVPSSAGVDPLDLSKQDLSPPLEESKETRRLELTRVKKSERSPAQESELAQLNKQRQDARVLRPAKKRKDQSPTTNNNREFLVITPDGELQSVFASNLVSTMQRKLGLGNTRDDISRAFTAGLVSLQSAGFNIDFNSLSNNTRDDRKRLVVKEIKNGRGFNDVVRFDEIEVQGLEQLKRMGQNLVQEQAATQSVIDHFRSLGRQLQGEGARRAANARADRLEQRAKQLPEAIERLREEFRSARAVERDSAQESAQRRLAGLFEREQEEGAEAFQEPTSFVEQESGPDPEGVFLTQELVRVADARERQRERGRRQSDAQEAFLRDLQGESTAEFRAEARRQAFRESANLEGTSSARQADARGEQALVDKLAGALGLRGVRLVSPSEALELVAGNDEQVRRIESGITAAFTVGGKIYVDPRITNAARRAELIAHELGHIVFASQIGKADAQVRQDLEAAFWAWRQEQLASGRRVAQIIRSKKAFNDAMESFAESDLRTLEDLAPREREYLLDFEEWFADNVARALTSRKEGFFERIARAIRQLFGLAQKEGYRANDTVVEFLNAVTARPDNVAFRYDQIRNALNIPGLNTADILDQVTIISSTFQIDGHQGMRQLLAGSFFTLEEKRVLGQAFFTDSAVRTRLKRLLDGFSSAQASVDSDPLAAVAYGFQFWTAGVLKLGPQTETVFNRLAQTAADAMGIVQTHDQATQILEALTNARIAVAANAPRNNNWAVTSRVRDTALQRAAQSVADASAAVGPHLRATFGVSAQRIRSFDNPALTQLTELFYLPVGVQGTGQTYFEARTEKMGRFSNIAQRAFSNLDEQQAKTVVRQMRDPSLHRSPEEQQRVGAIKRLFEELYQYAVDAGVDIKHRKNYFPQVWSTDALIQNRDNFITMLLQPKYQTQLDTMLQAANRRRAQEQLPPITVDDIAAEIYETLLSSDGYADTRLNQTRAAHTPFMGSINERTFDWIEPQDIEPFLEQELGPILLRYVTEVVKRAEFTRRFGRDGERIDRLLLDAQTKFGATPEELRTTEKFVEAMQGTLGRYVNTSVRNTMDELFNKASTLPAIGQGIAKLHGRVDLNTFNAIIITYQNIRLLGLATLTSLADPMGILLRSDLRTAWEGMQTGFREGILQRKQRSELKDLAEALGIINEELTNQALGWEFGTQFMGARTRKFNDSFFRAIGLTEWTKTTRLMALASAKSFLVAHKQRPRKHSERWLDELGIKADDIVLENGRLKVLTRQERAAAPPEELARDERIRTALTRFVDTSILRPNAAQRPIWASAPQWQLVFHLKAFIYAAHEVWTKRVLSELKHGNPMPMVYMLGFIPIMIAADWLRDEIQFSTPALLGFDTPDVNPRKVGWGPLDYAWEGAQRSGIMGLGQLFLDANRDVELGNLPFSSFTGPTIQQILNLPDIWNSSEDNYTDFLEQLPVSAVYKYWDAAVVD